MPDKLGAVKLQKIIWYFDIKSYTFTRQTATGATFVKGQFGPYTRQISDVIHDLVKADRLHADTVEFFDNEKARFIGKGQTDMSVFSEKEKSWLDQISTDICENHTADSISERSHGAIWRMAEYGEVIPFAATVLRLRSPSPDAIEKAKRELQTA